MRLIATRGPYKLVALSTTEATLYIYGAIGKGWWSDTGTEAIDVINALQALHATTIHVRIASDGGSLSEGLAIFNALKRHPATIITHNDSMVASIASVIFCAGDERYMPSNTMAMLHGVMGDGGIGNAQQIRERADEIEQMSILLVESYVAAVGEENRAAIEALLLDGKDHYLSADDCLSLGLCTNVEPALEAAAVRRIDLSRLKSLPAAAAVFHKKEPAMNWKLIALALGLSVSGNAEDTELRSAVFKELKLADAATDADVAAAIAARNASGATASPGAAASSPTTTNPVAPTTEQRVNAMFAAALRGQDGNQQLLSLQRATLVNLEGGAEVNVETVRTQIVAAMQAPSQPIAGHYVPAVTVGEGERDKRRRAATDWLLTRAAVFKRGTKEAQRLADAMGGNPFRGMSYADMARECLIDAGVNVRGMNRRDVIGAAITNSTSDFPNIFENALHKTLLAGFTVQPTTWDRLCKIGTLSDFRPHLRYRAANLGDLDVRQENGEFKTIKMNDAERESLQAVARGGIINISHEMLVNDDMGAFNDITFKLGQSASRTREKAVYALLAMNGNLGPLMGDGKTLFHADHENISGHAGAPSVVIVDQDRQQMASHKDPSGNDFLDIRPAIWLGPLALGGTVRVINSDQYDPDANSKLQRTNISRGTYSDVIDTPRLTGAPWYSFADPNVEPVLEMGFVDGEQQPQLTSEEAFTQYGMKWRIVDEWGLGAIGWRGAIRNAGA